MGYNPENEMTTEAIETKPFTMRAPREGDRAPVPVVSSAVAWVAHADAGVGIVIADGVSVVGDSPTMAVGFHRPRVGVVCYLYENVDESLYASALDADSVQRFLQANLYAAHPNWIVAKCNGVFEISPAN